MPLIVGALLGFAMTLAVAKNDQAHKDALQKEQQQIRQQHDPVHPVSEPNIRRQVPGG
jgi:hypothetical protein